MTQVIIDDVIPRTQLTAAAGQTVFNTNWTANATTDIDVYARATGVPADDVTQLVDPSNYNVTFIGSSQTVRVTFLVGRTLDDIITIARNTPADRMNLYINTNFVPSMLNEDFGILTLVDQQAQMYDQVIAPHYNVSATIDSIIDVILPVLDANQIWAMNPTRTGFIPYDVPAGGGLAPDNGTYLIQTADPDLPDAQVMGNLATGFVVNTTGTGVQLTRTLQAVANQIAITDGSGLLDDPTFGIAANVILPGTAGMGIPAGTTAQRVTPTPPSIGMRFNTDLGQVEAYIGATWVAIPSAAAGLFLPLAGGTMTGNIDMDGNFIVGLVDPVNADDAANKGYVDAGLALKLNLAGGTMSGDIDMDGNFIHNLPTPLADDDAASKIYVDNAVGGAAGGITGNIQWNNAGSFAGDPNFNTDGSGTIEITGSLAVDNLLLDGNRISASTGFVELEDAQLFNALDANAQLINNLATPIAGTDAATKDYVDQTALNGTSVYAATTTNLTVTQAGAGAGATLTNAGAQAIFSLDGVNPPLGSLVLVKNLANAANEGIYSVTDVGSVATNWVLTRATSYDTPVEINNTGLIIVRNGSSLAGTAWYNTATIVTVDTTNFNYVAFGLGLPVTVPNGGTGRSTLDVYRLLAGGTTNTGVVQSVNPGSNGQLLQSKGNAALPDFTTATYPTTTTANRLLYSSSTNVVGELATGTGVNTALGQNVTGSGGIALQTSPTFVTPILGVAAATSLALSGATALNYFEIGTFTPTITATTPGNLAVTYGTRGGQYLRINNQVFISVLCVATNMTYTSASGAMRLGNLPFAAVSPSDTCIWACLTGGGAYTEPTNTVSYGGLPASGLNSISVVRSSSASGALSAIQITSYATANGANINMEGFYYV